MTTGKNASFLYWIVPATPAPAALSREQGVGGGEDQKGEHEEKGKREGFEHGTTLEMTGQALARFGPGPSGLALLRRSFPYGCGFSVAPSASSADSADSGTAALV